MLIASQTIPVITLSPLLLVWFGPNIFSKVVIVAIISFFPIIVNFLDGLRSADLDILSDPRLLLLKTEEMLSYNVDQYMMLHP